MRKVSDQSQLWLKYKYIYTKAESTMLFKNEFNVIVICINFSGRWHPTNFGRNEGIIWTEPKRCVCFVIG